MTIAELKKHLDEAERSPKEIAAAVSGLADKTLRFRPSEKKWCILEILNHLADVEIVYAHRLRQMLADKEPVLAPFDPDDWSNHLGYMEANPAELVALYGLNRHQNLRLLRRLKPADLDKSAFHLERKRAVSVAEIVEMMGVHGGHHLEQIERLRKDAGSAESRGKRPTAATTNRA
jgi:uncharacterized damage-inducible protein DinB